MWSHVHALGNIVLTKEEVLQVVAVTAAKVSVLHHSASRRWRSNYRALKESLQCHWADDMRIEVWEGCSEGLRRDRVLLRSANQHQSR
jgi:hypothetical protein